MKLCILSRAPKSYSTERLREVARKRGHEVRLLNPLKFTMHVEEEEPQLLYKGRVLPRYDAVIPRIGASVTFYATAVVRQFEQMGVFTLNSSHGINVSRDKLRSLQVLSRHAIGIPPTAFVSQKDQILPAIERVGGAPVIVKLLEGTQGVGVILAETLKVAEAIVEAFQSARQNVLIQKFVAESAGRDVRAFVVGGQVVAAMRRTAKGGEFRSNVHRGGSTESVKLPDEYVQTAIHAAHIMGLRVAGVDLLEGVDGPKVMEVNSSPGLEGIENATGVDVAGAILDHLEEQVLFPEVDLHQRLRLGKGYGVTEFRILRDSSLRGLTLEEARLREQDVLVLSIRRRGLTLPNPGGDTRIMLGDELLCFGKQITLKGFIPVDRSGRRRKPRRSKKRRSGAPNGRPASAPTDGGPASDPVLGSSDGATDAAPESTSTD